MISFFAGDNARFAGKTVVDKYTGYGYASYNGNLEFLPGLGLLETTAIMPNAFISADTYENTVSGLSYAMMADSLKYGLYITGNTFAEYGFTNENKSYFKNISGTYPLIFLENDGTYAGFANQGPNAKSRNIAGFESLKLSFLGVSDTAIVGQNVPTTVLFNEKNKMNLFPNPAKNYVKINIDKGNYSLQMYDLSGKIVFRKELINQSEIDLKPFKDGIYIINFTDLNNNPSFNTKLYISK